MQKNINNKQQDYPDTGKIRLQVHSSSGGIPVKDAVIYISDAADPDNILEKMNTDCCGMSEMAELAAPPVEYSLQPKNKKKPYSEYTIRVEAPGYEDITVKGAQILSEQTAIQPVSMRSVDRKQKSDEVIITPHTLYGNYPPKIAEAEIKSVNQSEEIALKRVIIPEFIVVHDGPPRDRSAKDYYVRYKDYVKNVTCCELYATWPEESITANILAIMSFTMNRVYTEWYRNKGFNFTITSSTILEIF